MWKRANNTDHTSSSLAYELAQDAKWDWDINDPDFDLQFDNSVRQVKRYRKEAQSIIDNTIYGRFPVKK